MCHMNNKYINPFKLSVAFHIETSHSIYRAKLMNGFCKKCSTGLKWVKQGKYDAMLRNA